jgi:hypothetical protein
MSTVFASTSFAEGLPPTEEPPIGCLSSECEPPEEPAKGNNGWGNGPDTTNAGSFSGGTAVTKSVNGRGVDKFDGKFEGR